MNRRDFFKTGFAIGALGAVPGIVSANGPRTQKDDWLRIPQPPLRSAVCLKHARIGIRKPGESRPVAHILAEQATLVLFQPVAGYRHPDGRADCYIADEPYGSLTLTGCLALPSAYRHFCELPRKDEIPPHVPFTLFSWNCPQGVSGDSFDPVRHFFTVPGARIAGVRYDVDRYDARIFAADDVLMRTLAVDGLRVDFACGDHQALDICYNYPKYLAQS